MQDQDIKQKPQAQYCRNYTLDSHLVISFPSVVALIPVLKKETPRLVVITWGQLRPGIAPVEGALL